MATSHPRARLLTVHVFHKIRAMDLTLGEFEALLDDGAVIETTALAPLVSKRVLLVTDCLRPLHVVVDDVQHEERILTVYEPEPRLWSVDFRERTRS